MFSVKHIYLEAWLITPLETVVPRGMDWYSPDVDPNCLTLLLYSLYADPESFVRGGPTLTTFLTTFFFFFF